MRSQSYGTTLCLLRGEFPFPQLCEYGCVGNDELCWERVRNRECTQHLWLAGVECDFVRLFMLLCEQAGYTEEIGGKCTSCQGASYSTGFFVGVGIAVIIALLVQYYVILRAGHLLFDLAIKEYVHVFVFLTFPIAQAIRVSFLLFGFSLMHSGPFGSFLEPFPFYNSPFSPSFSFR
jgi:hypothetical protein